MARRKWTMSQRGSGWQGGGGPCHRGGQGGRDEVDPVIEGVRVQGGGGPCHREVQGGREEVDPVIDGGREAWIRWILS